MGCVWERWISPAAWPALFHRLYYRYDGNVWSQHWDAEANHPFSWSSVIWTAVESVGQIELLDGAAIFRPPVALHTTNKNKKKKLNKKKLKEKELWMWPNLASSSQDVLNCWSKLLAAIICSCCVHLTYRLQTGNKKWRTNERTKERKRRKKEIRSYEYVYDGQLTQLPFGWSSSSLSHSMTI